MDDLIQHLKASAKRLGREAYAVAQPAKPAEPMSPAMAAEYEAGWTEAFAADWETQ